MKKEKEKKNDYSQWKEGLEGGRMFPSNRLRSVQIERTMLISEPVDHSPFFSQKGEKKKNEKDAQRKAERKRQVPLLRQNEKKKTPSTSQLNYKPALCEDVHKGTSPVEFVG